MSGSAYKPPYMPLYVDDYDADTMHLTLEEDGAYNRLLRLCWRTTGCSLPDDPRWISRRMRVDIETYHRLIEPLIKEFFRRENGRIFQGRQRREYDKAVQSYKNHAKAGAKGGRARRSLETNETDPSLAKAGLEPGLSNQNQNQNQISAGEKEESPSSELRTTREVWPPFSEHDDEPF